MKAEYIDHMGDDLRVVNAARVSFDKESNWVEETGITEDFRVGCTGIGLAPRDAKLIGYLADHNHWTPFSHCAVTLRETVPIFVARQRFKHTVGFSYNEVSRRYVDSPPEFFFPSEWRAKADNKKQGSSDEVVDNPWLSADYGDLLQHAQDLYNGMLALGVCPEQARMVLPQSMYTSYYVTGSLAAWARAYKLRSDPHSQKEIQDLAAQWTQIIAPLFPVSWAALLGGSSSDETTVDGVSSPRTSSTSTPSPSGTTTSNSTQLHLGL